MALLPIKTQLAILSTWPDLAGEKDKDRGVLHAVQLCDKFLVNRVSEP